MNAAKQLTAIDDILEMVSTSLSPEEVENYAFDFLPKVKDLTLLTMQVPVQGYYNEGIYSDFRQGEWSIRPDWNGMIPLVQEFLFGETYPFDEVDPIPKAPNSTPKDS